MRHDYLVFLARKLLEVGVSLLTLSLLTFALLKALPGGPFDDEMTLNSVVKAELTQHWQTEAPWYSQAVTYLGNLAQGDLGVSMLRPDRSVAEIISSGLGNTLKLNSIALGIIIFGALLISVLSMRFRGSAIETLLDQMILCLLSLPSLFWGPLLIYLFGFHWNLLPIALLATPWHYILPVLTLSLRPLASLVRLLKNSMNDNYHLDYVRTAKAKGVSEWGILSRHVLKNSMIPFLSYLGPLTVSLLSGSFLVEVLFAVPGLGTEFISALNDRDYTLIMGLTLFYGFMLIVVNLFIDLLLRIVDPRLREEA
ncbi:oligopeptide ABC transporter, permease protein [Bdellovibrio bacteriovorus W]|nr:oligopeptide ABC transporter, permease protein [Bdellovibrio bacteriovorus W]